jgi:signal transduction histidine kinase/DNA-binding response OmpR family regulator
MDQSNSSSSGSDSVSRASLEAQLAACQKLVTNQQEELVSLRKSQQSLLDQISTHKLFEFKVQSIFKTVRRLSKQHHVQTLIDTIGDELCKIFEPDVAFVCLINEAEQKAQRLFYQAKLDAPSDKAGSGVSKYIMDTKKILLLRGNVADAAFDYGIKEDFFSFGHMPMCFLGVPIPLGDLIIGTLNIYSKKDAHEYGPDDVKLLSTLASNLGILIQNAHTYQQQLDAKEATEEALALAEQANEAKSSFLSTVSHELRTPLTSVIGFAKIISKKLEKRIFPLVTSDDTKVQRDLLQVRENLSIVVKEGERLTSLINDVLDLAKIEAGKMNWHVVPCDLIDIIDQAIASTHSIFASKNLPVEFIRGESDSHIAADRDKMVQVMINLFSNAAKFTDAGGVKCLVRQKDNLLIVEVRDTGVGIASDEIHQVFEKFKQAGDTMTDKPKGTGLGLPICKEIVEYHGGKIWVESKPEQGSSFFFSIPSQQIEKSTEQGLRFQDLLEKLDSKKPSEKPLRSNQHYRVLVVDDENSIRDLICQHLLEAGYSISEASNGNEAVRKARDTQPDLIILDVMMPELNGFDAAAIIRNDPLTMDIPILILSIVEDKPRGRAIGVDRYLHKPIDADLLLKNTQELLEQGCSSKKIMIVDNNEDTVSQLSEVLERKGYHVSSFRESDDQAQPDIVMAHRSLLENEEAPSFLVHPEERDRVTLFIYD